MTSFKTFIGVALLMFMASFLFVPPTRTISAVGFIIVIFCYIAYEFSEERILVIKYKENNIRRIKRKYDGTN